MHRRPVEKLTRDFVPGSKYNCWGADYMSAIKYTDFFKETYVLSSFQDRF